MSLTVKIKLRILEGTNFKGIVQENLYSIFGTKIKSIFYNQFSRIADIIVSYENSSIPDILGNLKEIFNTEIHNVQVREIAIQENNSVQPRFPKQAVGAFGRPKKKSVKKTRKGKSSRRKTSVRKSRRKIRKSR